MSKYTEHIVTGILAVGLAVLLAVQIDRASAVTCDRLHQYQHDKIDSLQARLKILEDRLIDGAIIVIDCDEQSTGRKTENEH